MEFIDAIQGVVADCVKGMDILDVGYATVVSISPLIIQTQATQTKIREPVVVPTNLVKFRDEVCPCCGEKIVINPGLKAGDKILYLKANAGQNYIVLTKVE